MLRVCLILVMALFASAAHAKILIFAAASMTEIVDRLAAEFQSETGIAVVSSYGGTGQLARQIDAGAPADVFISADKDWMEWLSGRNRLDDNSIKPVAGNRLVIAVRGEVENWADIPAMLTGSRFAMGDPASVPAGEYARQALTKMGLWDAAKANAVFGENVRLAMKRLELGEVEAAIVYASDVQQAKNLRVGMTIKSGLHEPIVYRAAMVKSSKPVDETQAFLAFLQGAKAQEIFKQVGFTDGRK